MWLAHSQGLTVSRVDDVVAQSGLQDVIRRKAGGYSLGMRQRLGIAAALLGDPPVLTLDEPFNGMDPEGIIWMRGFLRSLAAQGRAVLVSSHLMGELQDTADHLVVVGRGRATEVLSAAGAEVAATGPGALTIANLTAERVVVLLSRNAVPFSEVSAHRATLEDAYLELTRDAVEFRAAMSERAAR
jgi:ABC-2 type transport system ATP-binding protein